MPQKIESKGKSKVNRVIHEEAHQTQVNRRIVVSRIKMKILSLNFLTCAVKACKSSSDSYPLHPKDAELVQDEIEVNPNMILNVLPRLDWAALRTTSSEVQMNTLLLSRHI